MYSLTDKIILITGGTGSFGQRFTEVLLKEAAPRAIRIYSRGELLQVQMEERFGDERIRTHIGDVRDYKRLHRAMDGVDVVVHAAALKHVPVCEYNPFEAVKTNIDGTMNVVDAAIDAGVERVVLLSSDKAVHPTNLYGATKMVAERLIIQGNSYTGGGDPRFSCVRYGNVIGSRGSVIPVFMKQMETGTISITDERMTRFWITLDQGVRFVIRCIAEMRGGEVFVPKIPSMRLTDLADVIAPCAERKIVGIRPGEKLHEVLITEDEARHTSDRGDYFVIEPEFPFWTSEPGGGTRMPPGSKYDSLSNTRWLTKEEMRGLLS